MQVIINGEARDVPPATTVADVVRSLTSAANGVAVAVNDQVVPRTGWADTAIGPDDRVDVLTAVQGG
ncbi:sulfur carrier protein ThiS [Marinitenerispora sediminis]|uniref:Thiamine biosynthesis protein ThiS n=1 Tax=Marinitenerispora sediminis TaxID=1931232 RepID=A0A368TCI5_9ACTN|nr:sulfur carrier protein ThiS [Marinitenerispora sediminis]RCV55277.1 thiamine biosynthesis protein ThiS [Marinitenerispora sediminis]RCV61618.1 thiamine biosynthesis protein ThiS [Marinitenerispora sediminis]RCV62651.1 thiamine biosynthesis protein ThiS [Marinitenerispora sediminis]